MAGERVTRGRLSSLDLVPEAGQDDIVWAMGELNQRKRTQSDILDELNGRLVDKGLDLISKSAFNRKAVAVAKAGWRMAESRAIFAGIAEYLTPESIDDSNIALGEFIKTLIAEIVSQHDGLGAKEAKELSQAFQAVSTGQKLSFERRVKSKKEERDEAQAAARQTADAVAKVATEAGLSAERVAQLRREFLGVRPKPAVSTDVVIDLPEPVLELPETFDLAPKDKKR